MAKRAPENTSPEGFGIMLARHFVKEYPKVSLKCLGT